MSLRLRAIIILACTTLFGLSCSSTISAKQYKTYTLYNSSGYENGLSALETLPLESVDLVTNGVTGSGLDGSEAANPAATTPPDGTNADAVTTDTTGNPTDTTNANPEVPGSENVQVTEEALPANPEAAAGEQPPTDPTQAAPVEVQKPKKYINGYTANGRLMVPIRTVAEPLGLSIKFESGRLVVENVVSTLEFFPGSKKYILNGYKNVAESATFTLNGQNYVPFNVLAKAFDISYFHNTQFNWIEITLETEDLYIYIKPDTAMYSYKPKEIVALMYHHFQDGLANGVVVSPERFREHLKALKAQGYETITEQDYLLYLQGKTNLPLKPLLITIDDGYESNYLHAFPILAEEGYKGTVYLTTSKAETKPGNMQYMSWAQMKEMVESGVMEIQSHTNDLHYQLPKTGNNRGYALVDKLPNEDYQTWRNRIKADLRESKQLIEQNVGNIVFAFAYPYGIFNEDVIKMLKEEGYTVAFTIVPGKNTPTSAPMQLKRYTADGRYTGSHLVSIIK